MTTATNGTTPTLGALAVRVDAVEERLDDHRGEVLRAIAVVSNQLAKVSHAIDVMPQTIADIADRRWDDSSKVTTIERLTRENAAFVAASERTASTVRRVVEKAVLILFGAAVTLAAAHWFH